jgi:hypothetical protein
MKRNYKCLMSLVGSLAVSLNTLCVSLPAAAEEEQVLPPQELPNCPEKLPILEADKTSEGTDAIPVTNITPSITDSSTNPSMDASLTVPKTDPISTTELSKQAAPKTDQSSQTNLEPKVSHSLLTSTPLSVPPIEPPTKSRSTSLVKPSYKSLPLAPSASVSKRLAEPLAQSAIPMSPSLPSVAEPSAASTAEMPHTRYLPMPPSSSASTTTSEVSETTSTSLEPESPVSQTSTLQAAIGCNPTLNSAPVIDSAQTVVVPKTPNTESSASAPNDELKKSMENSEKSLKGLRPF